MIGAIAGDIIGSVYEWDNIKTTDFPLFTDESHFTDDSVLTIAVAEAFIKSLDMAETLKKWGLRYPNSGYGSLFIQWLNADDFTPYHSYGNGSAMRVSACGWLFNTLNKTIDAATKSAMVTHNHPEGIKGAQAVASAIFLARTGKSKDYIAKYIMKNYNYNLTKKISDIRPDYTFVESCQGSVPESIIAFLESTDFENAIRLAVSIGGDSDTITCITGSIAEAFYGEVPLNIRDEVMKRLPSDILEVIKKFEECKL